MVLIRGNQFVVVVDDKADDPLDEALSECSEVDKEELPDESGPPEWSLESDTPDDAAAIASETKSPPSQAPALRLLHPHVKEFIKILTLLPSHQKNGPLCGLIIKDITARDENVMGHQLRPHAKYSISSAHQCLVRQGPLGETLLWLLKV